MKTEIARRTIFEIPAISVPMRWLCRALLKITGWRFEGQVPVVPKCVVVLAPHTSNWDFPVAAMFGFALDIRGSFLAKDSMFRWPLLRRVFYLMGGIPVDRSKAHNLVDYAIQVFRERDRLMLGVAPEGTRKRVEFWRTGFYHIAMGAQVPMAFAFLDYGRKVGAFGPVIFPTGDIEADIKPIRELLAKVTPRHPELAGPVAFRPKEK